jgi:hypothetical protein
MPSPPVPSARLTATPSEKTASGSRQTHDRFAYGRRSIGRNSDAAPCDHRPLIHIGAWVLRDMGRDVLDAQISHERPDVVALVGSACVCCAQWSEQVSAARPVVQPCRWRGLGHFTGDRQIIAVLNGARG